MLFWLVLLAGIALSMIALAYLLDRRQDRPKAVSQRDWQAVSNERTDAARLRALRADMDALKAERAHLEGVTKIGSQR